ncbi:hypothetical protein CYQ88_01535 [Hydrogenovibrio sp. SC-1]|uniref:hypothetical protein n=1 Tax=Hydrogenovibrio sp. SC-1 TaxID=2065820 RepID=UPI000C79CC13|nr:hypothetical protein [Hydrogenovibrio sp. SC-1]PLA75276.1 hypothetical protein CYQ88_01535 [Hydrogenovibrio sp. SC-1]
MKSDEPITPKASQRVIDGEVVDDGQPDTKASASTKASKLKTSSQWLPKTFMQKLVAVSLLALLGLGSYWVWQTSQQDWQIEHINQLQIQQQNLKNTTKALQEQLDKQAQQLAQLSSSEQTPAFSQADLDQIKSDIVLVETQLKERVSQMSESLSSLSERFLKSSEDTVKAVLPSEQQQQDVQQTVDALASKFNQEVSGLKQQLGELLDFKAAQSTEQTVDATKAEPKSQTSPALSELQRQQWIVQINTQWILGADAASIAQQLNALEQAAALSDWSQKNTLLRLIGEDMAQLKRIQTQDAKVVQAKQIIDQLSRQIQALARSETSQPAIKASESTETPAQQITAWQQLLQKIQALFSIQKRDSQQQLSEVQQLIQRDVLIQRALLHLDRIDWALEMGSKTQLMTAKQALSAFMTQYFPQNKSITDLLAQIESDSLSTRQPLQITGAP